MEPRDVVIGGYVLLGSGPGAAGFGRGARGPTVHRLGWASCRSVAAHWVSWWGLVIPMAWLLASGVTWAASADGGFFMFTDAEGTVHFGDRPRDERYRAVWLTPVGLVPSPSAVSEKPSRSELDGIIVRVAREQEMDPALVKAVVAAESNFDVQAVSRVGALGLMQLMPTTVAELGVVAPFNPGQNVRAGTYYLKKLLGRYDVLEHALAAYNAGPGTVDRYGGVPPFPETRDYVARVMRYHAKYRKQWRQPNYED